MSEPHDPLKALVQQDVFRVAKKPGLFGRYFVRHMGWHANVEVDGEVREIVSTSFSSRGVVQFHAARRTNPELVKPGQTEATWGW